MYQGRVTRRGSTVGDPDLKNEKSKSYEARLNYKVNDKWNINLTGYKYDIDDMINYKDAAELGLVGQQWKFRSNNGANIVLAAGDSVATNIDKAELQGFELGIKGKLSDNFNLNLCYTDFNKAQDKTANTRLTSVPEYRATMALEYHKEKTTSVLALSHQGKTKQVGNDPTTSVSSSTVCDFYIKQQCNKDFSVYLKVANIGDKDYILTQNAGSRNALGNQYYYEDGRTVTFGMELKCD
jgi:outer membrane receptor for ferrienterochelin and colicin